jgi:adenylylsulfate kinase-like enzyme
MIIWFTGIPCSGKTTIAKEVAKRLEYPVTGLARITESLDGDDLRNTVFSKFSGFSKEGRERHLLRVGYLAQRLERHVSYVLCSFVSPYEELRNRLPIDLLVYVKCGADECARRDVKGMWAKAKAGELKGFTGYDAPYEAPSEPDVVVDTLVLTVDECAAAVLEAIADKQIKR